MVIESDFLWALEEVRSGSCWRKSYGMMTTCHMSKYPASCHIAEPAPAPAIAETYAECRVALHDTPAPTALACARTSCIIPTRSLRYCAKSGDVLTKDLGMPICSGIGPDCPGLDQEQQYSEPKPHTIHSSPDQGYE